MINYHELPDLESSFFYWLNELFEEILVCPVPYGNYIIYAGKRKLNEPLAICFRRIEPIQNKTNIRFDGLFRRLKRLNNDASLFQMIHS